MPERIEATVVIPAYNEEKRIAAVLGRYLTDLPEVDYIVVAEGDDATASIADGIASSAPNLRVLSPEGRLGKGGAVFLGFRNSETPVVGFVDCDTSVSTAEVRDMLSSLGDHDAVIASRRLEGSSITEKQPLARRLASRSFNLIIRTLFSVPWRDTQCGAKVFRRSSLDLVLPDMATTGFEFDVELLWRMHRKNMDIIEYPVEWRHSDDSKFRLSASFGMFKNLILVRLKRN